MPAWGSANARRLPELDLARSIMALLGKPFACLKPGRTSPVLASPKRLAPANGPAASRSPELPLEAASGFNPEAS